MQLRMIFFIILFNHYLQFWSENDFLAGYEHSEDQDQDDQPGYSGPHKPPPGVPHVLLTTSCFCAQPQVPTRLQFDFTIWRQCIVLVSLCWWIDKWLPRGPIILHSECSGRSSYLVYWAYFTFSVIFNIFLIFECYKKLTGWIFLSKEQTDSHYLCVKYLRLPHLKQSLLSEKGTIPLCMQRESADFPWASCDKSQNSGDGCRWW